MQTSFLWEYISILFPANFLKVREDYELTSSLAHELNHPTTPRHPRNDDDVVKDCLKVDKGQEWVQEGRKEIPTLIDSDNNSLRK